MTDPNNVVGESIVFNSREDGYKYMRVVLAYYEHTGLFVEVKERIESGANYETGDNDAPYEPTAHASILTVVVTIVYSLSSSVTISDSFCCSTLDTVSTSVNSSFQTSAL